MTLNNTLIKGKTRHSGRRREMWKKIKPASSASLLTVTVACLQNDLGRPLYVPVLPARRQLTSKRNTHSSLWSARTCSEAHVPQTLSGWPNHLYLFLYLSKNRTMPLSEECSPDTQKYRARMVTSTILVKKIKNLWRPLKTELYRVHWRVVQGNASFMIQHNLYKEASLMGEVCFCKDSWISAVQNHWKTTVEEILCTK